MADVLQIQHELDNERTRSRILRDMLTTLHANPSDSGVHRMVGQFLESIADVERAIERSKAHSNMFNHLTRGKK